MILKDVREKKGMTQQNVADQAGLSRAAYTNIEIGKRKPSIETAMKIGSVLGFEWSKLYEKASGGEEAPQ